jgi:hypothetical protein
MAHTPSKTRDLTLDFTKGIGCLLMVFSHSLRIIDCPTDVLFYTTWIISFIGRFAPIFFFSVSGVVNALQARRKPLRYFLAFAGLFAVYGITYNALWRPGPELTQNPVFDIPQIVAAVIIATVIVEKCFDNAVLGYALVVVVAALAHFVVRPFLPDFPGKVFLFIPLDKPGVYPILPWLVFPFCGNLAYRISDRALRIIALVLLGITAVALPVSHLLLPQHAWAQGWTDKYSMPLGYFLLSLTVQFGLFTILRQWGNRLIHPLVLYVGRNSFPFLYLHLLWIGQFGNLRGWFPQAAGIVTNPFVVWAAILLLTLPSIWVLEQVNKQTFARVFEHWLAWVLLLAVTIGNIVFFGNNGYVVNLLGLIFAYNYRLLAKVARHYTDRPKPAPAPMPVA